MAHRLQVDVYNPLLVEPLECSVCLKDMWAQVTLKCGHKYHFQCINRWFDYQMNCPYCRRPFSPPPSPVCQPPPPSYPPPQSPVSPPSETSSDVSYEMYEETSPSTLCAFCFGMGRRWRRQRVRVR